MSNDPFDYRSAEVERYELRENPPYSFAADRREFVQLLGSGLVILAVTKTSHSQQQNPQRNRRSRRTEPLGQRFHLGEDGVITVLTSKVEVGQGSRTQISQAAAEEFRLPVEQIRLVMADSEQCPDDGGTAGSRTTPSTVPTVRKAASAARQVLIELAARELGVEASAIEFHRGQFSAGSEKTTSLSELASNRELQSAFIQATPDGTVEITPHDQWQVLGTSVNKVGGHEVVTGAAVYPSDIIRPNMMYGRVLRPASYEAELQSIDLEPARSMDDTVVVRDGDFVGVAATNSWLASKALLAIAKTARWKTKPHPSSDKLYELLKTTGRSSGRGRRDGREQGDVDSALSEADQTIDVQYKIAYVQHAPMEPRAAVAEWNDGRLTVWTGTQQPSRVHSDLCRSFNLPRDQVRLIVPDTGGGFGGKHTGEAAIEAARLSKAARRPVHIRWTREEEFAWAYFRPAGLIEIQAGLKEDGTLSSWDFANYNSGGSAIETPYRVANHRTRFLASDAPLRQGSYRALASTANTFARESAMDELALLANTDPLTFRLQHLNEGRLKDVLKAAANKFEWRKRRDDRERNRGVGLACGTEKGSYTAACAEVEVVEGAIRIVHVCQAFECGAIQNPANLQAQVEGCLIMGIGGALHEQIKFEDGRILNPYFSSYRVPRMYDVPDLDIVLLDRPDLPSVGAGETPIIAIAPAIANAIYNAVGTRCRTMPMTMDDVR